MTRRPATSIVANPILVGAITALVVVVAVFLAYNANNGLPFVPTRTLYAELPNGAELNEGVEVREGGYRIGVVEQLEPGRLRDGRIGAIVRLKLDESAAPFPRDSRVVVRPRSPLALKIIQFERGVSQEQFEDEDRVPAGQSEIRTDLDELYELYDAPTRVGVQGNLQGLGTAFTGRGQDLATTIRALPEFLGFLRPVMGNLAHERTDLPSFFKELADTTRVVAPVATQYARSFGTQADTYSAINRDPEALKATIEKSPPTMDDSIASFRVQRPLLREATLMSRELNLASRDLRAALPPVNDAIETATPVLERSVSLNDETKDALGTLGDLAATPTTNGALRGLTATVATLQPQLRFLGPFVTVCNYLNLSWTMLAESFTHPVPTGGALRLLLNSGDADQDDDVSNDINANEPATGRYPQQYQNDARKADAIRQYAHRNGAGINAIKRDGTADCTSGQRGYPYGANRFDTTKDEFYKRAVVDPLFDGTAKGSTFSKFDKFGKGVPGKLNRPRVPDGQTFTDVPGGRGELTEHDKALLAHRGQPKP